MSNNNENFLTQFIRENFWNLAVLVIGIAIAYTALSSQVNAIAQTVEKNESRIDDLTQLVQRVIVLEESDKHFKDDLEEIKSDIKDIKRHFEIQPTE